VTSSDDNTVRVWSVVTGAPLLPPLRHFGSVATARFSADGKRLATASGDNSGRVWDAATGEPLTPPLSHRGWGRVTDVAFSPDGDRVVTASADGTAQVWPLGRTDWPAEDLERLAELLGGSRIGADAGSLVPLDAGALGRLWDELRARHPEAVGPSP
jgi:WD40 repeat protein